MALYPLLRPLAFALDAERAHRLTIRALKLLPPGLPAEPDPVLAVRVAGLDFPNPVGLAAGFDKDAEVFGQMLGFGFGFVEVGTLTPRLAAGQCEAAPVPAGRGPGGDQPAGLQQQRPGGGAGAAGAARPARRPGRRQYRRQQGQRRTGSRIMPPGCARCSASPTISPSTSPRPTRRGCARCRTKAALDELLAAVMEARGPGPPLFLKVAPDLEPAEIDAIARMAIGRRVDALIVGNTTLSRPALRSRHRHEAGGLSGAPLKALALERLRDFRAATGGALPLIAAGGIENGVDAFDRIRAGASLVQLYTALVYRGPGLVAEITRRAQAAARARRLRQCRRGDRRRRLGRRLDPEHAFAPGIRAAEKAAAPEENAVEAGILALAGPELDAARARAPRPRRARTCRPRR